MLVSYKCYRYSLSILQDVKNNLIDDEDCAAYYVPTTDRKFEFT